ncbi:hypothetical protein HBI56_090660 [Parastagonospora nodorum]|nr:hypothetical protein HBH53_064560 [Parastagonospora nodorum]KAH3974451.1 hypothetical protein HBH51_093720 [Parastagonospora nodorum]KAH3979040.1 hypothetical protein HBH52_101690 [Parastagonospora nodorum]KAH3999550.1 hypothetical protein HBI10_111800 [Parastagonospora nodorum]KAH4014601.1 hypothetical protein HBI13_168130 [Parastagonospora nodorum]
MLTGDLIHKQVLTTTIGTAAEPGDAKAVRKCLLTLLEGRGTLHDGVSRQELADNLVYVIEKKLNLPVDTTKFRFVLTMSCPGRTDFWRLTLLYGDDIVLKSDAEEDMNHCMKGLLKASGKYIHTRLLD